MQSGLSDLIMNHTDLQFNSVIQSHWLKAWKVIDGKKIELSVKYSFKLKACRCGLEKVCILHEAATPASFCVSLLMST